MLNITTWKSLFIGILVLAAANGLLVTTWKKYIRKLAKPTEVKLVALVSTLLTVVSAGYGLEFPGIPWTLIVYVLTVYAGQYLFSQEVFDSLWKLVTVYIKTKAKEKGLSDDDLNTVFPEKRTSND